MAGISILPSDLLGRIVRHLDACDVEQLALTSKVCVYAVCCLLTVCMPAQLIEPRASFAAAHPEATASFIAS